jgi:2-iminobutanoate/2-iminopropanoate deaminase
VGDVSNLWEDCSMPDRRPISTPNAPDAIGPYSQAMRSGHLLFCSGQIPLDPSSGELVKLDVVGQTRRCLENLSAVCEAAGGRLADAVKCTLYLTDMNDFARVNEVYEEFFPGDEPPARVAVAAAGLPKGADVEIDAIVAV